MIDETMPLEAPKGAVATANKGSQHRLAFGLSVARTTSANGNSSCLPLVEIFVFLFLLYGTLTHDLRCLLLCISYTQYVNKAASSIRGAVKEPVKSRLMAQDKFSYKSSSWTAGEQGAKTEVTSL